MMEQNNNREICRDSTHFGGYFIVKTRDSLTFSESITISKDMVNMFVRKKVGHISYDS